VDVIRRSATPHDAVLGWVERLGRQADVSIHPSARVVPGVLVYRLDDGSSRTPATCADGSANGLRAEDITFVVARAKGPMRSSFDSAGLTERIGEANFYPTVRAAVDAFPGGIEGARLTR
jgi:sulfate permease, SulP family